MVTQLSVLAAQLFALAFVSVSLGAIFGTIQYKKISDDAFKNTAVTLLFGFLSLIVGALLVFHHNIWEQSWAVIITLFGWISLAKGVFLIIFPGIVATHSRMIFKGGMAPVMPYVSLVLGLVLGYYGFFV